MKKRRLFLLFGIALGLLQACTVNEDEIGTITIIEGGGSSKGETDLLSGEITNDLTLDANTVYELSGGVVVKNGATLTIPAGTRILAGSEGTAFSFLLIEQGAKLLAEGTENAPIVFTSNKSTPNPGDWGGILLCGRAPINRGQTATSEVASAIYGGTDPEDNSGSLKYVRIEYSGGQISSDSEFNGLSLYGVGSGTTIEHIEVYQTKDDGIEFFGGTVNLRYALVIGAQDDCFDWTDGWVGKGQFWVAQQLTNGGDKGMECDNLSSTPSATPFSYPTISNITLLGASDGDGENKGIEFRAGTKVAAYNMIIRGFDKALEVDDDQTILNLNAGEVLVANSILDKGKFDLDHQNEDGTIARVDFSLFAKYSNYSEGSGIPFETQGTPVPEDFTLNHYVGTYSANAMNPVGLDQWFAEAPYVGAVHVDNDWTNAGWIRK